MNRREALQNATLLLGGAISISTASVILNGCKPSVDKASQGDGPFTLSADHSKLLDQLTEIIIPKTDTPGAIEAGVGPFIVTLLSECYKKSQQDH
ncbi:MAG TPA: gluconate 2-dehydrogenase subunit 3 family protein, partial [Saprospiraceae bacterium]|nr:gluconate 2-dehydrogenase subunit 3 family protein [Saprospiraceae bacterium]